MATAAPLTVDQMEVFIKVVDSKINRDRGGGLLRFYWEDMVKAGKLFEPLKNALGLTQEELALRLGCSRMKMFFWRRFAGSERLQARRPSDPSTPVDCSQVAM